MISENILDHNNSKKLVEESLKKCFEKINSILNQNGIDSEILVLDYTYCLLNDKGDLNDIQSFYFHSKQNYKEFLENFIEENGNSIEIVDPNEQVECSYKFNPHGNISGIDPIKFDSYKSTTNSKFNKTKIEDWHSYCERNSFGGFMMTTFYKVSPNHLSGIYLVLSKSFEDNLPNKILIYEIRDTIKDYLMTDGWRIIYEANILSAKEKYMTLKKDPALSKVLLAEQIDMIAKHRHIIRNFSFERHLGNLYHDLKTKNFDAAIKKFFPIEKLILLRDLTTDFIYNFGQPITQSLIYKKEINTYSKILNLVEQSRVFNNDYRVFYLPAQVELHPANKIKKEDLINAFSLVVNLYSNCEKNCENSEYGIRFFVVDDTTLKIIFFNKTVMPSIYVKYLQFDLVDESVIEITNGIKTIRESIVEIKNCELEVTIEDEMTSVCLTLKS